MRLWGMNAKGLLLGQRKQGCTNGSRDDGQRVHEWVEEDVGQKAY